MSGCGLGATIVDPELVGAVVVDAEFPVDLGAGQGLAGPSGAAGASAFQIAKAAGFQGGVADWLASLAATRPEHSYALSVAAPGQTRLPLSPPPTDLNGLVLEVNGVAYRPPTAIAVSPVAVTWTGGFDLDPSDDVRVTYL